MRYDTLAAGEVNASIDMDVNTSDTEGTLIANLRVASLGNPGLRDSINLYTNVGLGIEEGYENLHTQTESPVFHVYPNPFIKNLDINYEIRLQTENVTIQIYDCSGKLIKQFIQPISVKHVTWDATDDRGRTVPLGMYLLILKSENQSVMTKVTLIK
ncbi:hypothetical protein AMJ52_04955 [candidate division TA06 bacterium DG_78]|uniref:Secretion system C-terminal sorting domain-containing protein n=1 Tax=candidate division TA06 bacterium DG_78 TaxID=1703772 RepID=A0A0S7YE86_UNCT6|nr:MAG: hypothetical protein AMJ52_04955 [candidate division TA06 bacterium DG_78]